MARLPAWLGSQAGSPDRLASRRPGWLAREHGLLGRAYQGAYQGGYQGATSEATREPTQGATREPTRGLLGNLLGSY